MSRLNLAQRIVIVTGLGVGLWSFGGWLTGGGALVGWVGSAPLSNGFLFPDDLLHSWVRLVIMLALTAVWVAVSLAILRTQPRTH